MIKYDDNISMHYGIKLLNDTTVLKQAVLGTRECFECIRKLCNHFILYPDPMVVPVYSFEFEELPNSCHPAYGTYKYSYTMKRLGMLSAGEKQLIEWMIYEKRMRLSPNAMRDLKEGMEHFPELSKFMKEVINMNRYSDMHSGNFLIDTDGSYKIIDIEGFIKAPLNCPENFWFTKNK